MQRLDIGAVSYDEIEDMDQEERETVLRQQAEPVLEGIIAAAQYTEEETKEILVTRNGKAYFKLVIRPVSDAKSKELRRKCTRYVKSKAYGVKIPEDTDMTKFRSLLVYEATVNKEETWDNKTLWKSLEVRYPIVTGWETVDLVLLAGEKDRVVEEINEISGYTNEEEEELEETIKN